MLKIILVQDFCPLKIKITQFPNGFRLNTSITYVFEQVSGPMKLQLLKGCWL